MSRIRPFFVTTGALVTVLTACDGMFPGGPAPAPDTDEDLPDHRRYASASASASPDGFDLVMRTWVDGSDGDLTLAHVPADGPVAADPRPEPMLDEAPRLHDPQLVGDGERTMLLAGANGREVVSYRVDPAGGVVPIGRVGLGVGTPFVAVFDGRDTVLAWQDGIYDGEHRVLVSRLTLDGALAQDAPVVVSDALTFNGSSRLTVDGRDGQSLLAWWRDDGGGRTLRATRIAAGHLLDVPELVLRPRTLEEGWSSRVVATADGYWLVDGELDAEGGTLTRIGRDGTIDHVAIEPPAAGCATRDGVELDHGEVLLVWACPNELWSSWHAADGSAIAESARLIASTGGLPGDVPGQVRVASGHGVVLVSYSDPVGVRAVRVSGDRSVLDQDPMTLGETHEVGGCSSGGGSSGDAGSLAILVFVVVAVGRGTARPRQRRPGPTARTSVDAA